MSTPFDLSHVPDVLKTLDRWLCWRYEMRDGKQTKVPYHPATGHRADTTNSADRVALDIAVKAALDPSNRFDGIGFVFDAADGLVGIDLDDCIGDDGLLEPWAQVIVNAFETYTEISPSGKGVKLFLNGTLDGKERRRTGNIEMYSAGRYFTVTGNHLPGTPASVNNRQEALDELYRNTFAAPAATPPPSLTPACRDLTDEQVIDLASKARNGDKFKRLWSGETSGYRHDDNNGHSEADLALCSMIAFYTGPDADRIDRIFRMSGLYREKWLRQDYREATIERALAGKTEFYKPGADGQKDDDDGKDHTLAGLLVELAIEAGVELFHTPDGEPTAYATIRVEDHHETWAVNSMRFKRWLQYLAYDAIKKAVNDNALNTAVRAIEAQALFKGKAHAVFLRVGYVTAESGMTIYLDLGDALWRVVEITATGWRVLNDSPVKFRRTRTMKALPAPVRGGSITRLRRFVNAPDDYSWHLLVGFAISMFHPTGGYPVLVLNGEAGSAKSTTAKVLRRLSDPSALDLRQKPKSNHDLCVAAGASWVLAFDNLSFISDEFSDTLCTISTGGGMGARKLYTDDDEHSVNFTRPVILTGIDELVVRDDLLSRAIRAHLPRIPKSAKLTERQFWREFAQEHPYILGALLDGCAAALRNLSHVEAEMKDKERMADFCVWATAAEPGLGLKGGAIMRAYTQMLSESAELTLEASPIAPALLKVVGENGWSGTATQLLDELKRRAGIVTESVPKGWPKQPNQVMGHVLRLAVPLRQRGFEAWRDRCSEHDRTRLIHVRPIGSSGSSGSSDHGQGGSPPPAPQASGPSDAVRPLSDVGRNSRVGADTGTLPDAPDDPDDQTPSSATAPGLGGSAPDAPDDDEPGADGPRRPPFGWPDDFENIDDLDD